MSATSPPQLPGAGLPDDYRGDEILGAVVATTTLAFFTVCARLWVRLTMIHRMGSDDYAMIVAMILSLAGLGLVIPQVIYGAGRHIAYLRPAVATVGLKINFVSQVFYLWAIPAVKMSIGLFLLRIAPNKGYRRALQGVMVFTMAYTMMCFVTLLLQCTNLAVLWDPTVQAVCWSKQTLQALSYANSNMFFAVLPAPMLWNVQINVRTKASLICIMGLGVFAVAAAIVKSFFISNYGKTGDFLWDSTDLTIWVSTECNTGIIAACLPCLKPLFKRILENTTQRYGGSLSHRTDRPYKMKSYGPGAGPGSAGPRHLASQTQSKIAGATGRGLANSSSTSSKKANKKKHGVGGSHYDDDDELALTKQMSPHAITKVTTVTVDSSAHQTERSWWSPTSPRMRV